MRCLICLAVLLAWSACLRGQDAKRTIVEWTFDDDLQGWGGPNHVAELRVAEGAMQGRIMDWDPFVRSPEFEIPASPWQSIEVRLKTDCGGQGQIFFTNTTEGRYGGFSPEKLVTFDIIGDDQWHAYEIDPYWHTEGKIILIRLDLARPDAPDNGKKTFAVDYLRIVERGEPGSPRTEPAWDFTKAPAEWIATHDATCRATDDGLEITMNDDARGGAASEPIEIKVGDRMWVSIEMAVDKGSSGTLRWVSGEHNGLAALGFPIRADGKVHTYNIDLASAKLWSGEILLLGLTPSASAGAKATVRKIAISEDPLGPPEVEVTYAGLANAVNRVGRRLPFIINLMNRGGETATDLRIADLKLPKGVTPAGNNRRRIDPLEPYDPATLRLHVRATEPVKGEATIRLEGKGAPPEPVRADIFIEPSLNLPKADYVPEPQPVESDYEIGALYYPGWGSMARWEPIRRVGPERKPVLGWYDEGNPECADWQIKWAVEHGITYFLVDWYWSAGGRHNEHWLHNAYMKSRYRKCLKWAMMWANHNPAGTHSEEDQRAVTQFWIDNYFGMDEYYRIDDMPVVMIWSVGNMDRDMAGKGGAKRLLDISQEMAREAGYKGIYFIAMKWPEASTDPGIIQGLADAGFSMTSIYHYMHHGGKAANPRRFSFDLVAESTGPFFRDWHEASREAGIPFLPNLSTGWASQPWHGEKGVIISGRSVELFRRICEDAKRFADETGVKRMVLAPVNEWGEGSYVEPCKEFGFGMYDAIRDTFCKQPAAGWPQNMAPSDVALGPYDFPEPKQRFTWDFDSDTQGWGAAMGVADLRAESGALVLTTTTGDPAISTGLYALQARKCPYMIVRMKVDAVTSDTESGQLFWTTPSSRTSEAASVKWTLIGDGEYHDYILALSENARWKGRITSFRLDPCSHAEAKVAIDEIRMSADGK